MTATNQFDAVVVGAGPNGLTAAARLAVAGRRVLVLEAAATVGGGSRTAELTADSRYDVCAAAHPFGACSPAFEALHLAEHGLAWCVPPVALAHPFDDGTAAVMLRDVDATVALLGAAGGRWRRIVGTLVDDWERVMPLVTGPVVGGLVRHPLQMAKFGLSGGLSSTLLARVLGDRRARAIIVGLAAHGGVDLGLPTTAAVATTLAAAAHVTGMPFAAGGSQSIADALASVILAAGGEIECDRPIERLDQLPAARALLLDLTPPHAAALLGRRRPRWRHGVGAWKLDLLLAGPMPWTASECREAGTIHLGGPDRSVVAAERETIRGGLPNLPYVIVTQPSVADASRAPAGQHVVWAYRHVPNALATATTPVGPGATVGIEAQFDRFAPGWRDLELHRKVTTSTDYAAYNRGYVGGDIAGGAMTPWQTVARPRLALDPYHLRGTAGRAGADGVWLCSQSTPPGPGVHGLCGWHAAGSVIANT